MNRSPAVVEYSIFCCGLKGISLHGSPVAQHTKNSPGCHIQGIEWLYITTPKGIHQRNGQKTGFNKISRAKAPVQKTFLRKRYGPEGRSVMLLIEQWINPLLVLFGGRVSCPGSLQTICMCPPGIFSSVSFGGVLLKR